MFSLKNKIKKCEVLMKHAALMLVMADFTKKSIIYETIRTHTISWARHFGRST